MDFFLTLSAIISPYNDLLAHRLHWSCFSISFCAMKPVPWDEQGMSMVLAISSFSKSSSRSISSSHVFLGHKMMSVVPSLLFFVMILHGPDPSGREEVMIKQISPHANQSWGPAMRKSLQSWSFGHQTSFKALWSALGESDSAVPCHLQETFGRMSRNCFTLLKRSVLVKLKNIFNKRWHSRNISNRNSVSLNMELFFESECEQDLWQDCAFNHCYHNSWSYPVIKCLGASKNPKTGFLEALRAFHSK